MGFSEGIRRNAVNKIHVWFRKGKVKDMKKFVIEIECDGNIDVEGMEFLVEDMLNNKVNCTEMTFNVEEVD